MEVLYPMSFNCRVVLLALLMALGLSALAATPEDYAPERPSALESDMLYAEAAFLFDMDTADILLSKNGRVRMYPASTTKIMTCLLALESSIGLDDTVTIPKEAGEVPEGSSVLGIRPNDTMTWRDLLYGLMLRSGNDASNAIAVLSAGSIESFVRRMNERAAQLHCEGTHFVNAHGYHNSDHYTTAQDLARMAYAAMQNPDFRLMAAAPHYGVTVTRKGKTATQDAENRNSLVVPESNYYYPYATGIKTGHHNKAGRCVVASAERDGMRLMAIVMNCSTEEKQFADAKNLFEYGFTRYTDYTMAEVMERLSPEFCQVEIENSALDDPQGGQLTLYCGEIIGGESTRKLLRDSEKALNRALNDARATLDIRWSRPLTAPVAMGERLGIVRFAAPDGTEVTAELLSTRDVAAKPEPTNTPAPTAVPGASRDDTPKRGGPPILPIVAVVALLGLSAVTVSVIKSERDRRRRARKRRRKTTRSPQGRKNVNRNRTVQRTSRRN